ncbi:MAG: (2Fe-2S) ferredoxin domain-containing protein [Candidatus Izimaplasma sp.]|nr:(2Fe-2S) ferredoxin domain-containing protein [Candidatus Izimaplasma bacterium]
MAIKSLDALKAKQKEFKDQVSLRNEGTSSSDRIEVLVGLATCGFAVGADDTFIALEKKIKEDNINAKVTPVGCIGYCHREPTVQVNIPGQPPILYGDITEDKVTLLVDVVLKEQKILEEFYLEKTFDKAVL